ncbi:hypothetical protein NCCP2716_10320 [Sporosarcina sp. NCCP-2716]|uniref:N-acetylglucosamine-6-phosphate deacetylase n=1 Tax=Sporosarcina sp. NCCP-2716 TaxID=2943679 RepID=UPI00203C2613|nr:N-acetylglucosamine-6-phosphate deacetylase [Sporosarcina sp. NCCP-2716]GKV68534.1 hypothetical protein NCCP2716_10320 [Sporosarcina sp. NCCP-2716]
MAYLLKRSKLFIFLIFILMLVGVYTFLTLPKREIPETPVDLVMVSAILPGAEPEETERALTNPLERAVKKVDGIDTLQSVSANSASIITISLKDGVDSEQTLSELQSEVQKAAGELPDNAQTPEVKKLDLAFPLVSYMFTGDEKALEELETDFAALSDDIQSIEGVAGATVKGYAEKQVIIDLDPAKLAEYRLQPYDVLSVLQQANQPVALGTHDDGKERVVLSVQQEDGIDKLKSLQIGDAAVPLSKLADIGESDAEVKDIVTFDGEPAVSYTVFLQPGQDIPSMDKTVAKKMDGFISGLPDEVSAHTYESQADNVNTIFDSLYVSLLIAVIAVLVVTTAGLTWFGSFAVALTVLASVLTGLIPIPFMGVDLNQISVIGLIIAIGILVDDSIVVNDNIQRRYKLGDSALDGAVNGVKEVYSSIISSSLAIVVTFSPLLLLSGGNGAFIKALPSILITTIIASTILSVTLVPMMQYIKTKRRGKKISDTPGFLGKPLEKIAVFYSEKVLRSVLKRPLLVGLGGLVIATGLLFLALLTPFEFFPAADKEEVTMNVRLAEGTALDETNNELQRIMDEVAEEDGSVKETALFTGDGLPNLFAASMDNTGENTGQAVFRVKKAQISASEFINKWEPELRKRNPDAEIFLNTIVQGPPVGAPVTVTVKGDDIDQLASLRDDLKKRLLDKGDVLIEDGRIVEVGRNLEYKADEQVDAAGQYVLPGFIDMHIHGAAGADVMDATPEAIRTMADVLPKEGTTSFLATSMTQAPEAISAAMKNLAAFNSGPGQADMLGVHLEGPFVSSKRAGAQPLQYICPPDADQFDRWQQESGGKIKMVTLAPEEPDGMAFIRKLASENVIASLGHTDATVEQMEEAAEAGAKQATHLYNQMSPFHHREPGAIGGALLTDGLSAEIIADFIHSHPKSVELAYRMKGPERLVLITDAMRAKGLEPGEYELGGQPVHVTETDARLTNGALAGSILKMDQAVKNVAELLGLGPVDMAKITSGNAARQLGLTQKGAIAAGKDADLVVLDDRWNVVRTICGGRTGYERDENQ